MQPLEQRAMMALWTGGAGNGNWSDAGNWSGGVPDVAGETATFSGAGGAVNLDIPVSIDSLSLSAGGYTINATAPGNTLTLLNTAGDELLQTAGSNTINAPIAGSGIDVEITGGALTLGGANTYSGTTSVSGTLTLVAGPLDGGVAPNPLGTSTLAVNNGNVVVQGPNAPGLSNSLSMSWFQYSGQSVANNLDAIGNNTATGGMLGQTPTGVKPFAGPINFGTSDAVFQALTYGPYSGARLTNGDNYGFTWRGTFTPTVSGNYTFGVGNQAGGNQIDDAAAIFLDLNGDSLFNTATGERVAYRATSGGSAAGSPVALTAGTTYNIVIGFLEAGGNASIAANVSLDGGAASLINPGSDARFRGAAAPSIATFAGNAVSVSGTSAIEVQVAGVTFGALDMAAGSVLNLNGAGAGVNQNIAFGSGVLAGAASINTNTAHGRILGVVSQTSIGTFTKGGGNVLTLSGANTYGGDTIIAAGTLRMANNAALGNETGKTVVQSGATLDILGSRVGANSNELVEVTGTGVGGLGAIVNTGASQGNAFRRLTLTGNATFRSDARWDVLSGAFDMGGFTLTKVGGSELVLLSSTVANEGNINVNQGIFRLEGSTDFDGPTRTISVAGSATLDFWNSTHTHDVNVTLAGNANLTANGSAMTTTGATVGGTVTLSGTANITTNNNQLTLSGPVTGAGGINKNGSNTLRLTNDTNSYTGFTQVNTGTLRVAAASALGSTAAGTRINDGASLVLDATAGSFNLAAGETLQIGGQGVSGAGALQAVGNDVTVGGVVNIVGDTRIASTTDDATLTLAGTLRRDMAGTLTFTGAGDIDVTGDLANSDYSLSPITALVFTGAAQAINDATVINNDLNGTTVPARTATYNGSLTFGNAAAFNAIFSPAISLTDNFTTLFVTTLTVNNPGTYTFAVTNNDDGAAAWLKPAENASFVAGDMLQGIVVNSNTTTATRTLAAGTYTLLYAHRENGGGESVTGRLQGPGFTGQPNATFLPIVRPSSTALSNVVKTGAGTLTLAGDNTYDGQTLVQEGAVIAASATALGQGNATGFVQQWQVGSDNGTQTEFAQENGASNAAPGSATARDDDWYFAGAYPAPIGTLGADEVIGGTSTGFERALTTGDPTDRIHFNLGADQLDDNFQLVIDVVSSNFTGGNIAFDVYFNEVLIDSRVISANGTFTTPTFNGAAVNATTGDNVVRITRATTGGGWMQFDYLRLNRQAQLANTDTQVSAGATLDVRADIGAEALTVGGALITGAGVGTVGGSVTLSGDSSVGGAGNLTINGNIGGAFGLTKVGAGTLTLSGANTYTGATAITGGVVSVSSLASGGAASNLGQSSNAASNLVLDGGTLRYTGSTPAVIDRLFTLGAGGGTLDSSGSTANAVLSFTNTGAIAFTGTGPRTLTLTGSNQGPATTEYSTATPPSMLASALGNGAGGNVSLVKSGNGAWVMTAGNSYAGGTSLDAGHLAIRHSTALGTGDVDVAGGAQLALSTHGLTVANNITLNGITNYVWGANTLRGALVGDNLGGGGNNTLTGNLVLNATSNISTSWSDKSLTINGLISGLGGLQVDLYRDSHQGSSIRLSRNAGPNTYSGGTIINSGTLFLGTGGTGSFTSHQGALGTGAVTVNAGTRLQLWIKNDASFTIANAINLNGGTLHAEDGNYLMSGPMTVSGNSTLSARYSGKDMNVAGPITGSGNINVQNVNGNSGGAVVFSSAANDYAGNTTVTNNLRLGAANVLPDGAGKGNLTVSGNLNVNGFSETVNGLSGSGTISNGGAAATLSVGGNDQTSTFSGAVQNALSLTKIGSGVQTLSGNNTYTGATSIQQGTLRTAGTNIPDASAVSLAATGTLDLNNASETIGTLSGAAGSQITLGSGTLTVNQSASGAFEGVISGTGGLVKSGAAALALHGVNTYTGATQVNAGTLAGNGSVAGDVSVASGATLAPGGVPGDFTAGPATFTTGSVFAVDLALADSDTLIVAGDVDLNDATLVVSGNVNPAAGTVLTIIQSTGAINGTFNGLADGDIVTVDGRQYFLAYNANSVTLTRNVPVDAIDDLFDPVAMNTVFSGSVAVDNGLGADSNTEGDGVYTLVSNASRGNVVLNADGTFTYTPTVLDVTGEDSFTYQLADGESSDTATVTLVISSAFVDDEGTLIIMGTTGDDRIIVQSGSGGSISIRYNSLNRTGFRNVEKAVVLAGEGNDTVTLSSVGIPVEFYGEAGNDYLAGGGNADILDGGEGNDRLLGGSGNDTLYGGNGADTLSGGLGQDYASGDEYVDILGGTLLEDATVSQPGDVLMGSAPGNDTINGDGGSDWLVGGDGQDILSGGLGNDRLHGGLGNDRLDGADGHDLLVGDAGADVLYGRAGHDVMIGGSGVDTLYGYTGADLVYGGDYNADVLNAAALETLWTMWSQSQSATNTNLLANNAIDDHDADTVHGEADADWYLTHAGDVFKLASEKKLPNSVRSL